MFGRAISSSSLILTIGLFFSACGQEQVDNSGAFNQTSTNYGLVCPGEVPDTSSKVTIKAIYGEDNRLDWFEAPGRTTEYWARASLALMYSSRLFEDGDDFVIQGPTYQETANLCPGESFASQPSAAFCSGFLVAPDIVVTAGHCVRDDIDVLQPVLFLTTPKPMPAKRNIVLQNPVSTVVRKSSPKKI